jgi:hypothetical protein
MITCSSNEYAYSLGVAESYLIAGTVSNPKGGVCAIGTCTSSTHAPQNGTVAGGLIYGIADMGIEHIGHALNAAKIWLILTYGAGDANQQNFTRWNNLMGEPGISIWTDKPERMAADYPATANVGTRNVHVTVTYPATDLPVTDALVVLWKGTETWVKGLTDSLGRIDLPVTVDSPGDMMVTVTKRNHLPVLGSISCISADQMVAVSSYLVDDDNTGGTVGNGDGLLNPGETIDLPIYLRNFGTTATATSVTATLISQNPHVTIVHNSGTYPQLAPGDSAAPAPSFRIVAAPTLSQDEKVLLLLDVTASGNHSFSSIELIAQAGRLVHVENTFSGPFDPGTTRDLTVTLENTGSLDMTGVTALLLSTNRAVQVTDSLGTFNDIAAGASCANSSNQFTVFVRQQTYRGQIIPMILVATTSSGIIDTVQFTLPVGTAQGTDPTGPDPFGYFAYDNTDTAFSMHPTFSYVNISENGGENLDIEDIGEKTDVSQVWSVTRRLPFTFQYYGAGYTDITVCSNGWMAFGDQSWNDSFRDYPIPSMQAPDAMIAPYWFDLNTTTGAGGVWVKSDTTNHRFVIQWKASGAAGGGPLDFEVILKDPEHYPTWDGNGIVDVLYNTVDMNMPSTGYGEPTHCSIGIQGPGGLVGLPYTWGSSYSPGAAPIVNGRAISYTTDYRRALGSVMGSVTNAANSQPMPNVAISVDGQNARVVTNATGHFVLSQVAEGFRTVRATAHRFNQGVAANTNVLLNDTTIVNFSLTHPTMTLTTNYICDTVRDQPHDTIFSILNDGNGPLDFDIQAGYGPVGHQYQPWDSISGINVAQLAANSRIEGCEVAFDRWWMTGQNGPGGQNVLYEFNLDGSYIGWIPQPTAPNAPWYDLATDGQYLYGSSGGLVMGIDSLGQVQTTIVCPVNPARGIAYDPQTDHFWVGNLVADLYEIDRLGIVYRRIPSTGSSPLNVTGLAWNANQGPFSLYAVGRAGPNRSRIQRIRPDNQARETIMDLSSVATDSLAGCTVTSSWNNALLVFGSVLRNGNAARLQVHQLAFDSTIIRVSPIQGQFASGTQPITVRLDPARLRNASYELTLAITSAGYDTTMYVPVNLVVRHSGTDVPEDHRAPQMRYVLHPCYPNPFNPSTEIRFEIPETAPVELKIYNMLGQCMATLVNDVRTAGSYTVTWDGHNAASGVYFCRLKAGQFVNSRKLVLIR